jgi:hypothetical protein
MTVTSEGIGLRSTRGRQGRLSLAVVPQPARSSEPSVWFCSHCGAQPSAYDADLNSRVCTDCSLGVLLETSSEVAPPSGGAFLVLDSSLSVCAVSAAAERLLATRETEAVNHHITELLVPADAEAQGPASLAAAVTWAAGGDDTPRTVTVRPANTFGVRLTARIGSCSPPRAALLVFDGPSR